MKTAKILNLGLLSFILLFAGCKGKIINNSNITDQVKIVPTINHITTIPSNCISWFDGCNTCFVSNEKATGCTKKLCSKEMLGEPSCLQFKNSALASSTEEIIFKVGPKKMNCKNSAFQNCLVVNGELFYNEIIGFYFEPGFDYKILVRKTLKDNFSSLNDKQKISTEYIYNLIEIISKSKK